MPKYTENLNLFEYDVEQDRKSTYNISQCLNDNWDKIDAHAENQANLINNKVSKSGDTMTGDLYINKISPHIIFKDTQKDHTVNPVSADEILGKFQFRDKNNVWLGGLEVKHRTSDNIETQIFSNRYIDGVQKTAAAYLYVDSNGKANFNFPKCSSKPTTTSTANNGLVAVVTQNYLNGQSWYRVWSDGFCEQGGILTYTHTQRFQAGDVTLLKPLKTVVSKLACSIDQVGTSGISTVVANVDQDITSASDQLNKIRICVERLYNNSTTSVNGKVYWEVKGFIN